MDSQSDPSRRSLNYYSASSAKASNMSVVLATMDSAYGLSNLLKRHSDEHREQHQQREPQQQSTPLRFSVVNILRPDFGREAVLSGRASSKSLGSCNGGGTLSRSGSLESLASSSSASIAGNSSAASSAGSTLDEAPAQQSLWPAWIYCTRYSDRPSSGPRTRRVKRTPRPKAPSTQEDKRPRTAFSGEQLAKLRDEFAKNKYLNEERRQRLSRELGLNEQQIKIWFQNKRAKIKKSSGQKNPLALQLMAQGLYNHSTLPVDEDGEELSR